MIQSFCYYYYRRIDQVRKKGLWKRCITLFLSALLAAQTPLTTLASEETAATDAEVLENEAADDNGVFDEEAAEVEDADDVYTADDTADDSSQSANSKAVEIVEKRTADSMTFQMSDHSVKTLIFPNDISFKQSDRFILYNNGLYEMDDAVVGVNGSISTGYKNRAGLFDVAFAADADEAHFFSLKNGSESI